VQELRQLSEWSEAQFWSSPEQHGNITAVMKNQSEENLACRSPPSRTLMSGRDLPSHSASRLDSTLHWIGSTDSRENVGFRAGASSRAVVGRKEVPTARSDRGGLVLPLCSGQRRKPILQHRKHPSYTRTLDAHDRHTQSSGSFLFALLLPA
jgi:hypothetical protein